MADHSGSSILKRMMRRREKKPRDKFPHRSRRDSGPSSSDDDEEDDTSDDANAKEREIRSLRYIRYKTTYGKVLYIKQSRYNTGKTTHTSPLPSYEASRSPSYGATSPYFNLPFFNLGVNLKPPTLPTTR